VISSDTSRSGRFLRFPWKFTRLIHQRSYLNTSSYKSISTSYKSLVRRRGRLENAPLSFNSRCSSRSVSLRMWSGKRFWLDSLPSSFTASFTMVTCCSIGGSTASLRNASASSSRHESFGQDEQACDGHGSESSGHLSRNLRYVASDLT